MGNAVGDVVEQRIGNLFDGSAHCVGGIYGADDCGPAFVAAFVLNTYALNIGHSDKVLPNLFAETVLCKLLTKDGISFTQRLKTVAGDCAQAANAKSGAGEWLAVNHGVGQTKSLAYYTDLILKEQLERFNKLELEILGQSAYVVVRLNSLFALGSLDGLQNVGVDSSLCQEADAFQLACFFSKYSDKLGADYLALALGIGNTCQQTKEMIGSINRLASRPSLNILMTLSDSFLRIRP